MNHEKAIKKNGFIVVSPVSGSMRPLIRENTDYGYFISTKEHRPRVGDVVLYHGHGSLEGKTVMHRIIRIDDEGYIIQGDSSGFLEIVPKHEVFGVMTAYLRGKSLRSCKNPVFILYSLYKVFLQNVLYTYRTSHSFFFKGARFLRRKLLHRN